MTNILLVLILCISSTYCADDNPLHFSQAAAVGDGAGYAVIADDDVEVWDEGELHRIIEEVEAAAGHPRFPALGGGGIVGVFVPPVPPVDLHALAIQTARAAAHADAFPFAPLNRSFLCTIQRTWLKYWTPVLALHPTLKWKKYPLSDTVPSFGWQEQMRLDDRDETCQMCGHEHLKKVVIMANMKAPRGYKVLRVGVECATFMELTAAHVQQIAFDNVEPIFKYGPH